MKHIIRYIRLLLAVKFRGLRPMLLTEKEQLKISILELRSSFKFFGYDISQWSDEELIERVKEVGKALSRLGCTAKEIGEVALRIHDVVGRSEQLSCGRNITTCVFYKDGSKCSNLEYCKDQTT